MRCIAPAFLLCSSSPVAPDESRLNYRLVILAM
jgi:hypothetical protein